MKQTLLIVGFLWAIAASATELKISESLECRTHGGKQVVFTRVSNDTCVVVEAVAVGGLNATHQSLELCLAAIGSYSKKGGCKELGK